MKLFKKGEQTHFKRVKEIYQMKIVNCKRKECKMKLQFLYMIK